MQYYHTRSIPLAYTYAGRRGLGGASRVESKSVAFVRNKALPEIRSVERVPALLLLTGRCPARKSRRRKSGGRNEWIRKVLRYSFCSRILSIKVCMLTSRLRALCTCCGQLPCHLIQSARQGRARPPLRRSSLRWRQVRTAGATIAPSRKTAAALLKKFAVLLDHDRLETKSIKRSIRCTKKFLQL